MTTCIRTSPPKVYEAGLTFDNFGELGEDIALALKDVSASVRARRGFLFYGPTGVGKSSLAYLVHAYLADKGKLVRWLDCAVIPGDPIEATDYLEALMDDSAYVVIFDDLGQEPQHISKYIAKVIQARALMPARMDFITTNLNIDVESEDACELAARYGKHVRSRIFQMCKGGTVEFNGKDHRTGE